MGVLLHLTVFDLGGLAAAFGLGIFVGFHAARRWHPRLEAADQSC